MEDILDSTPDVTLDDIAYYVSEIGYPRKREEIIYEASKAGASQLILDVLNQLEGGIYKTWDETAYYLLKILNS